MPLPGNLVRNESLLRTDSIAESYQTNEDKLPNPSWKEYQTATNIVPRYNHTTHAAVGENGKLYIFGGSKTGSASDDFLVLDCRRLEDRLGVWKGKDFVAGKKPGPRHSSASVLRNNEFIRANMQFGLADG
jgi:hypothetical protein